MGGSLLSDNHISQTQYGTFGRSSGRLKLKSPCLSYYWLFCEPFNPICWDMKLSHKLFYVSKHPLPGKPKLQSSCVFPKSILTLYWAQLLRRLFPPFLCFAFYIVEVKVWSLVTCFNWIAVSSHAKGFPVQLDLIRDLVQLKALFLCFTFSLNCWSWSLIPILILPSSWLDCDATRRQVGSREVDGGGLSLRRPPLIPPTNLPPGHPTPQDHSSPHFSIFNKGVCWSTSKAIQS